MVSIYYELFDIYIYIYIVRSLFATQTQNIGYVDPMSPRQ